MHYKPGVISHLWLALAPFQFPGNLIHAVAPCIPHRRSLGERKEEGGREEGERENKWCRLIGVGLEKWRTRMHEYGGGAESEMRLYSIMAERKQCADHCCVEYGYMCGRVWVNLCMRRPAELYKENK